MSHRRTSSFNYHFDHGFVVFNNVQLRLIVISCGSSQRIFPFVMMFLPQVWSMVGTSRGDARKKGVFRISKIFSDAFHISWLSLIKFPHAHVILPSDAKCPQDRHCILDFFSSISSTLPISMIEGQDSWLNIMFFFARSSRIQILFGPILILSITSLLASFTASICYR